MWIIATLNKTNFYLIVKVCELVVMIQEFLTSVPWLDRSGKRGPIMLFYKVLISFWQVY